MSYTTTVTSKGTITIPASFRKKFGIKTGMTIQISENKAGRLELIRSPTLEEVRALNRAHFKNKGVTPASYKSGDGFTAHVKEKYGNK